MVPSRGNCILFLSFLHDLFFFTSQPQRPKQSSSAWLLLLTLFYFHRDDFFFCPFCLPSPSSSSVPGCVSLLREPESDERLERLTQAIFYFLQWSLVLSLQHRSTITSFVFIRRCSSVKASYLTISINKRGEEISRHASK